MDIDILPLEPGAYAVHLRESTLETDHKVRVPDRIIDDLGPGVDEEEVVRASMEFLLDREPPSAIMKDFSLDDIGRYFDDYGEELRTRLGLPLEGG